MILRGDFVTLKVYSRQLCHEFYQNYVADPMMTDEVYIYDENLVDKYYEIKVLNDSRRFFAILIGSEIIGEIQLKNINFEQKHATLSIILRDDSVKNKGYGTEAEQLIFKYAKEKLHLKTIYADAVKKNERSKHVFVKVGFTGLLSIKRTS